MDESSQPIARNERKTKEIDQKQIQISIDSSCGAWEEDIVHSGLEIADSGQINGARPQRSAAWAPIELQANGTCANSDPQ